VTVSISYLGHFEKKDFSSGLQDRGKNGTTLAEIVRAYIPFLFGNGPSFSHSGPLGDDPSP
jgi:hypothetical protein